MKKITLLLIAVLIVCTLASCDQDTKYKKEIQNRMNIGTYSYTLEQVEGSIKKELKLKDDMYSGSVTLKIWTMDIGKTDFDNDPDVTYTGTVKTERYEVVKVTDSYIEYTQYPCTTLNFTECKVKNETSELVKKTYASQMSLYSGSFDIELVNYLSSQTDSGGWVKSPLKKTKDQIFNFVVTRHPGKDTNQAYVLGEWKSMN